MSTFEYFELLREIGKGKKRKSKKYNKVYLKKG